MFVCGWAPWAHWLGPQAKHLPQLSRYLPVHITQDGRRRRSESADGVACDAGLGRWVGGSLEWERHGGSGDGHGILAF